MYILKNKTGSPQSINFLDGSGEVIYPDDEYKLSNWDCIRSEEKKRIELFFDITKVKDNFESKIVVVKRLNNRNKNKMKSGGN